MAEQDPLKDLGNAIKHAMARARLGVRQTANRADLAENTITNARGGRGVPAETTLAAIALACGTELKPLLHLREAAVEHRRGLALDPAIATPGPQWTMTADGREAPERHFNPLHRDNLIRSVAYALQTADPVPLVGMPRFEGSGLFSLYYVGPNDLYRPVSDDRCRTPLYVGSATPLGTRRDGSLVEAPHPLWNRLTRYRRRLDGALDLKAEDFRVRYLLTDDLFIHGAQEQTNRDHRPVWNVVLPGIGSMRAGTTTRSRYSPWEILHELRGAPEEELSALRSKVQQHLAQNGSASQ
ncbi:Eco29kI family restriction endonuclease [Streptomyces lavendulae]|uniref:Eco29kI family restriction endonuclease n=1 Tax=Streptomyces lavendulae TaxID=1914 RepID=UPI0036B36DD4